jgi:hypothetical protein
MAQFRGSLPDVFDDRQAELFFKEIAMEPLGYKKVFNVLRALPSPTTTRCRVLA